MLVNTLPSAFRLCRASHASTRGAWTHRFLRAFWPPGADTLTELVNIHKDNYINRYIKEIKMAKKNISK